MSGKQAQSSICADCAMGGGGASWMERRPAIAVLDGISTLCAWMIYWRIEDSGEVYTHAHVDSEWKYYYFT